MTTQLASSETSSSAVQVGAAGTLPKKWLLPAAGPPTKATLYHRMAVDEATRAIEIRVKAEIDPDLSGAALMTAAFNPAPPKLGERRFRFPEYRPGTRDWTSAHEGAMHFAGGCMQRIRNLVEHGSELDEAEAFESLASLSLLARWIEAATVVVGEA